MKKTMKHNKDNIKNFSYIDLLKELSDISYELNNIENIESLDIIHQLIKYKRELIDEIDRR